MDRGVMSATAEKPASDNGKADSLLSVRNLSISFNNGSGWLQTLKDVSLDVKPGEVVGIVGESGCGKSLTALSILGLLPRRGCQRTGEMLFEGRDLAQLGRRRDARRARPPHRHDLSGADERARSGVHRRRSDRRDGADAFQGIARGSERARRRGARGGRHCRRRAGASTCIRRACRAACASAS